ncbi:MAG: ATP-dependent Clp protease ATP-binding subunit [Ruminococcaceae bacterium]|nr:ATP-dependent Clp protease ATP-binding subunit [Oscillospiraceae bacterium]
MDNRVQMCSRCHKRIAVVFMTRIDNGESKQEGLCLVCARSLGIKPVNDMLEKMGITEEDIDRMSGDIENVLESMLPDNVGDETEDGGAPAINLPSFFQNMGIPLRPSGKNPKREDKKNGAEEKKQYKFLDTYCRNLTKRAEEGKLDSVVGRDRELARVIQILCRRQKNNPCLIGEPGVGKTAIAEALAQRIVKGDVPYRLKNAQIYLVDLTAIVAGTQFRGQFESRVLGLINDVKAAGNVILVIDEVHNIVGAGDAEGSMNAANILKPALSRGEIQVIGATTLQEYRKYIEKDSALERRFQPVTVEEPSLEDTVRILEGIKHYYEVYHAVRIPSEVLRSAAILSERYITDRFLPDKAIDLLDEAASHVSLSSADLNERRALADDMKALAGEKERIEGKLATSEKPEEQESLYRAMADIKARELQLSERRGVLDARCEQIALSVSDIADVIEIWTGVPASTIGLDEYERLSGLESRLLAHIVGQDEAVSATVRAIKRKRVGVSYHRAPVSFIFAGPTGVGKTELVKVLADDLFKQPESLIRLDMSEYMEKHAVSRIIGAPPGYVGFDEAGQLTEKIRRRPYSVVLFDEIEKAHPDVLNILLQILDDGTVTDAHGKKVNFENTVIVMTTNAGSESASSISGFSTNPEADAVKKTEKALSSFLRPEFLNRVDAVITFRHLSEDNFVKIAEIQLEKMKDALAERGISLKYTSAVLEMIAKESYSEKYGARNMRRYIQREIEDPLAEAMISNHQVAVTQVALSVKGGKIVVSCL